MKLHQLITLLLAVLLAAACSWQVNSISTDHGTLRISVSTPPMPPVAPQVGVPDWEYTVTPNTVIGD